MFKRVAFILLVVLLPAVVSGGAPAGPSLRQAAETPAAASGAAGDTPEFYAPDPVLARYVRAALASNPGVQERLARYRASLERVPIVTALPEPMLSFGQALRAVETRVGPQRNMIGVSQLIPGFGKLDLRGKVVVQEAAATYQSYRARQRDVIAQVKKAFYNLAYVDSALAITGEEQSLLSYYEGLSQVRYATGQGLQQAVIRVQVEITKVANRLDVLRQQRGTLAARLNTLMHVAPEQAVPLVAPLVLPSDVSLDLERLNAIGAVERPEIAAADALIDRGEWAIQLARKSASPDLTVGAGFVNVGGRGDIAGLAMPPPDNGRNAFTVTVGVTLPIRRDKYRADEQRATHELSAARLHRADVDNEMAYEVRDQVVRLETLRDQLALVTDVLRPQTDEALASTEAAYETGQVGVLDLLDSERSRLDVRLIEARDVADYLVALADLERAIGAPFPDATRVP